MRSLGNLPLQRKVTLVMVFACAVVLLATCGVMFWYQLYTFRKGFERSLSAVTEIMAANSSAPLAFKDKVAATEILSALKATPHVLGACVRTAEGERLVQYGERESADELRQFPDRRGCRYVGGHLLLTQPILLDGQEIGRLLVWSDYHSVFVGLLRLYASLGGLVLASALLLAWLLSAQLQRVISQPILRLVQTARQVAQEKDYSVRAKPAGRDEIGMLTESFNQMLAQIQEHDATLRRLNLSELQQEITDRRRAEEATQTERDRAQQYFDIAGVLLMVLDPEGRVVLLNQRGRAMLGYEAHELVGQDWFETCLPAEGRTAVREQFRQIVDGSLDGIHFFQTTIQSQAGERRIVQFYNTLIRDSASRVVGTLSSGEDVTERLNAEELHRLDESRMEALLRLNQMGDVSVQELASHAMEEAVRLTRSTIGYVAFVNEDESVLTMHAWSKSALEECRVRDKSLIYPVDKTGLWGEALRQRRPIITNDYAASNPWKKGTPEGPVGLRRHLNVPIFDGGRIVVVVGVGNKESAYEEADVRQLTLLMTGMWRIAQRKQAEEALRLSEEKFRSLFDCAKEVILIHDLEGHILEANREALDHLGYRREELLTLNVAALDTPEFAALIPQRTQLLTQQGYHLFESAHRRRDGVVIPVEVSVRLFELAGRRVILSVSRDITERKRAEEALRRSEENFRALFDNAKDAILIQDLQGRILEVNREACEHLGYSRSELLGMSSRDIETPEQAALASKHREVLWQQEHHLFESAYRRRDGTVLPVEISVRLFELGGQRLILHVCRDITERKQAEQALRESEGFVRSTLDALSAHLCVLDEHGQILMVNKAWRDFAAADPVESRHLLEGANHLAACEAAANARPELAVLAAGIRSVIREERNEFQFEYPWHLGSKRRWFMSRVTRFQGRGPMRLVVSHENITARKFAEQLLKESQERYRTLLANLPIGVYRSAPGPEGRLLMVNPALARMLGCDLPDELLQCRILDLCVDSGDRLKYAERLSSQGYLKDAEVQLRRKDGTPIWCRLTARVLRNEQGDAQHYDGTVEDITERRNAEREKVAMEMQLHQAQKLESIGRLAAGIAHEINTPTQYIGDNTRFLQEAFGDLSRLFAQYEQLRQASTEGTLTTEHVDRLAATVHEVDAEYLMAEVPKAIQQSIEGVERVAKIVGAMKEFSHPGSADKTAVNLNQAIESTVTVARNEWKYVADLVLDLQPALPPVFCLPGEFNQVILNLVINAAHAIAEKLGDGSKGKGTITVSTRQDGDWVDVRIHDTGAGIPPAIRPRMFEPFFTTKPVGRGTGQGLAIARSVVVDKHGGTITFESEEGVGTTFLIRLPINPTVTTKRLAA